MRFVRLFVCALGALSLLVPAAQAVVATGAYGNTERFDRLTGRMLTPSAIALGKGDAHPVRTAA